MALNQFNTGDYGIPVSSRKMECECGHDLSDHRKINPDYAKLWDYKNWLCLGDYLDYTKDSCQCRDFNESFVSIGEQIRNTSAQQSEVDPKNES